MPCENRLDHFVDVFPERVGALDATSLVLDASTLADHRQLFLHGGQCLVELLLGLQGLDVLVHDHQAFHLVDVCVGSQGDLLDDLQNSHRLGGDHWGIDLFDSGDVAHGDLSIEW
ncbi:hypothetical protein D3C78_1426140 [compost metagenome]